MNFDLSAFEGHNVRIFTKLDECYEGILLLYNNRPFFVNGHYIFKLFRPNGFSECVFRESDILDFYILD